MARIWGTPRASDGEKGGPNQSFGAGGVPLASQANQRRSPATLDPGITTERLTDAEGRPWTPGQRAYDQQTGRMAQTGLTQQAEQWVSPNVPNGGRAPANLTVRGRSGYRPNGTKAQIDLQHQARTWPTPVAAPDAPNLNSNTVNGPTSLGEAARLAAEKQQSVRAWPSPTASDHKGSGPTIERRDGKMRGDRLDYATEQVWSEPLSAEQASGNPPPSPAQAIRSGRRSHSTLLTFYLRLRATTDSQLRSEMRGLLRMAIRCRGRTWSERRGWTRRASTPFVRPSFRRQLAPVFVEGLMRWPLGWTVCDSAATAWTRLLPLWRTYVWTLGTAAQPRQGQLL